MKSLKKILYVFGGIVAVAIVGIGVIVFLAIRQSTKVEAETMPYVDTAIVAITQGWDVAELMARFTPEAREGIDADDLQRMFEGTASALGPLEEYSGSKLANLSANASVRGGTVVIAQYTATARYRNGEANFVITLQKIDGTWMIRHFIINAPTLKPGLTGRKS